MMAYLAFVRQVVGKLKGLLIAQILREENAKADRLARLTSYPEADLRGTRMEYLYTFPSQVSPLSMGWRAMR